MLLAVFFCLFLVRCGIHEVYTGCPMEVILHIQLHSIENRHLPNLQSVSVYIFDDEGFFQERYDAVPEWESDFSYRMKVPIQQPGSYRFVVWTNANQPSYSVSDCERNATRLQDAALEVRCGGDAVVEDLPAMLCYGYLPVVEVKERQSNEISVQMKRYTSMLKVIVHGLDEGTEHTLSVEYGSRRYRFDEEEQESATRTFLPRYADEPGWDLAGDFRLVRLNETRRSTLKITGADTKTDLLALNLIDEVLGKYPGVDFSKQFEFLVEITLRQYVPVQIKVNDWIVVEEEI